ncbi:MAG TPA: sugar phosphate nucleotidyltransferase [Candidatus Obscuribacterales bacterium]
MPSAPESELLRKAVILAGGLGTRLAPITETLPKPLVPVKGRPFLGYQLELLARHGVAEVLLLTGYKGEMIESTFGTGEALGLTLKYSRESAPVGTGGALAQAASLLADEFFLVYGDSYMDLDYQAAARQFRSARGPGAGGLMVVADAQAYGEVGNVRLDRTGQRVSSYQKGAGGEHTHLDAGVLILTKEVVDFLPKGQPAMLEEYVYPRLAREGRLLAFPAPAKFYDIGTPERLAVFERSIT